MKAGVENEALTLGDYPFFRHSGPYCLVLDELENDVSLITEARQYAKHGSYRREAMRDLMLELADALEQAQDDLAQKDKRIAEFEAGLRRISDSDHGDMCAQYFADTVLESAKDTT